MRNAITPLFTLLALLALPLTVLADDDVKRERPFSFEFSVGARHDSDVAVLELDTSSGQGDVAALVDVGLGFDRNLTEKLTFKLGYDFSQTLHQDFDPFDIRIHRGSTELAYDFGRIDAGVSYLYADAALDDEGFLVLKRVSPSVSRLFGTRLFVRLAYARTDKEFASAVGRDATAEAWSADTFVFLKGVTSYFVFGYLLQDEDALADAFDYDGAREKLQFAQHFSVGSKSLKLKTEVHHESRDYRDPQDPAEARREDDRYGFLAELELPLSKRTFLKTRYQYDDNRSNLASVNFDEHVVSVEFGAKF